MIVNRVLYSETQSQFAKDVEYSRFAQKMQLNAKNSGINVGESELASWANNAPHISTILYAAGVSEAYVTFEFLVPFSRKRIDCVVYGKGEDGGENVIHIELKQWTNKSVGLADCDGNFSADERRNNDDVIFNVEAFTGHANRIVAHPSQQVKGYQGYLLNFIEVISKQEITLTGLAYCYNYLKNDEKHPSYLYDAKYAKLLEEYPTYAKDQKNDLAEKLGHLLKNGDGLSVFNKMMASPIKPSKKLLNEVSKMIEEGDTSAFSLLEDQIVARNIILDKIRYNLDHMEKGEFKKSVIIVKGGPGTGKTVIALHLIAELAKIPSYQNGGLNIHYATKSKPLLEGVRSQVKRNNRLLFSNVTSFVPASADENSMDVLLVDEAHRIQKSANNQYTKAENRTSLPQIDTIIRAAKVSVFFIDDRQAIRGVEIGSSNMIREAAAHWNANVEECNLTSQFRCNGSDNYLDWIEQVLYNKEVTSRFDRSDFDLEIFDDPQIIYDKLVEENNKPGQTARMMAGFCWPWAKHLDDNGELVKDVRIGNFAMPWESSDSIQKLPSGYVKWYEWAYKPDGVKQVGCIYTAQGFEFDYAGVIIGPDLKYDSISKMIITDKSESKDPVLRRSVSEATMSFDDYVRNIYRVLMSRGMKGCYLYIVDLPLRNHMKQLLKECYGEI